ncbi:hypothetical protein FGG79_21050 [Bacillus sp. BHET2]|uniref:hypothetical protein n=1 Tax=Bacillus sp. BHET2 TaxID=2583818 RepID=UPI00110F032E|nr:hypothetical protein [Bacillus sp. BHET2]TMU82177.1 hypothetical protein FGG79_21050 [Bacillus sp. BHET2]
MDKLMLKTEKLIDRINNLIDKNETKTPHINTKEFLEIVGDIMVSIEDKEIPKNIEGLINKRISSIKLRKIDQEEDSPKLLVHIISTKIHSKEKSYIELHKLQNRATDLPLLSGAVYDYRFNSEGFFTLNNRSGSYTQFSREGFIEAVDVGFFDPQNKKIFASRLERALIENIKKYIDLLFSLDIKGPYIINVTLLGAGDYTIYLPNHYFDQYKSNLEELSFPQVSVNIMEENLATQLRPIFDVLWNSVGIYGSINYANGEWKANNY